MKTYVKPAMTALSISANDMLCSGSCKVQTRFDKDLSSKLEGFFPGSNNDGVFTPEEAGNAFASTESCTENLITIIIANTLRPKQVRLSSLHRNSHSV